MSSAIFLSLGFLWTISSLCAVVRLHRSGPLSLLIMMTGWLVGDHPLGHFLAQLVVTANLIGAGALHGGRGWTALGLTLAAWVGLGRAYQVSRRSSASVDQALTHTFGPDRAPSTRATVDAAAPKHTARIAVRPNGHFRITGVKTDFDVPYGEHPTRNLLDIYAPLHKKAKAPVLVQVHGGGWIIGHKRQQGFPLMAHMVRSGWVCVSINYRLGPKHRFPDQIIDVKRAITWVKQNISSYGGDPSKVVLTGGSAGGHLTTLAALTPDRPEFQPGFEHLDTSVAACVPFYGPADFTNRFGIRGRFSSMEPFLSHLVMPKSLGSDPKLWQLVSPLNHVNAEAPPFMVIQGRNDVLVWREETQRFVDALGKVSPWPVVYWEVPGAQHAFDALPSHRTSVAIKAIDAFLAQVIDLPRVP